jgi:hypothetical protein
MPDRKVISLAAIRRARKAKQQGQQGDEWARILDANLSQHDLLAAARRLPPYQFDLLVANL